MKKIILFQVLLIIPLMLFSQAKPFNAKIKSMAIFYTDSGKTVFINPGDSVSLISFDKIKTWKANYQGKKGTVSDVYLLQNKDYLDFRKKYVPIIKPLTPEERKVQIIKKYGAVIGLKIFNQRIWLGMTSAMALASWGEPNKVNRTVGKWGVNENYCP
jgi:hypothetical protein